MKISVLMSVYEKENPVYFQESLKSLSLQTKKSDNVVLVEDGPISYALQKIIGYYKDDLNIISVKLKKNSGLAITLNEGLKYCDGEIVIRMDSDDISLPNRIEKQIRYMKNNPHISVLSAYIEEIDERNNVVGKRLLPIENEEIIKFAKKRNPISHPCSVFRKNDVLSVGGYPLLRKSQDYALWSLMIINGYKFANIDEVLLKMRTGTAFLKRRGLEYLKYEIELLQYQRKIRFLNYYDFITNIIFRSFLRLSPDYIKILLYKNIR